MTWSPLFRFLLATLLILCGMLDGAPIGSACWASAEVHVTNALMLFYNKCSVTDLQEKACTQRPCNFWCMSGLSVCMSVPEGAWPSCMTSHQYTAIRSGLIGVVAVIAHLGRLDLSLL